MMQYNLHSNLGNIWSATNQNSWLDSVLGQTKQGIFSADFEDENNTWIELGKPSFLTWSMKSLLENI